MSLPPQLIMVLTTGHGSLKSAKLEFGLNWAITFPTIHCCQNSFYLSSHIPFYYSIILFYPHSSSPQAQATKLVAQLKPC